MNSNDSQEWSLYVNIGYSTEADVVYYIFNLDLSLLQMRVLGSLEAQRLIRMQNVSFHLSTKENHTFLALKMTVQAGHGAQQLQTMMSMNSWATAS